MKTLTGIKHKTALNLGYFLLTWERGEESMGGMNLVTTKDEADIQREFGDAVRNAKLRISEIKDKNEISEYNKSQGWVNWDGEEIDSKRIHKQITSLQAARTPDKIVRISDEQFDKALDALLRADFKVAQVNGDIGVWGEIYDQIDYVLDKAGLSGYQISE